MLYIHQYPDWTNFRYNYQSVSDTLGKTRLLEGKLVGIADLVSNREVEAAILSQDIVASFALDNYVLDAEQVKLEIAKRNGAVDQIRNILGALQNANTPLTEDRLFAWHAAIGQNKVRKFREKESQWGVSPDRIPHEMERFLTWFETATVDGAIKAAIAQFWFLTIRPFEDGNGRIARTLSAMLLARNEETARCQYALNAALLKNRDDYNRILYHAQIGNGDLTEWILFFLGALRSSIETRLEELAPALRNMQFRMKFSQMDFTPRERRLLEAVLAGELPSAFSVKEAAALTGVSHDSSLRDIQSLMAKGIFKAETKGGRSQKYSLL
ncbi:MAG: DUF4172 domain-containing protein [Fibrobacter sp.]|nr:DUF4172 domain-containing protein [Fibrobacter sp.]